MPKYTLENIVKNLSVRIWVSIIEELGVKNDEPGNMKIEYVCNGEDIMKEKEEEKYLDILSNDGKKTLKILKLEWLRELALWTE